MRKGGVVATTARHLLSLVTWEESLGNILWRIFFSAYGARGYSKSLAYTGTRTAVVVARVGRYVGIIGTIEQKMEFHKI